MTDEVRIAIIASLPGTLLALATLLATLKSLKKVEEVRHATNSLTDRLIASTKLASHAEGVADEKARSASPDFLD